MLIANSCITPVSVQHGELAREILVTMMVPVSMGTLTMQASARSSFSVSSSQATRMIGGAVVTRFEKYSISTAVASRFGTLNRGL